MQDRILSRHANATSLHSWDATLLVDGLLGRPMPLSEQSNRSSRCFSWDVVHGFDLFRLGKDPSFAGCRFVFPSSDYSIEKGFLGNDRV